MASQARLGQLALVGVVAVITAACSTQNTASSGGSNSKKSVLIAGVVGASGAYGEIGVNMGNAGKLAIEKLNADGGILGRKVEWKFADDQGNPTLGAQLFQKFAGQGAIAIVGSGDTGPATAATAEKLQVLDIGIVDGGGPVIYPKGPGTPPLKWVFGYSTSTYELGSKLADYALANCKATAVLHDQTSYGEGASQAIVYAYHKAGKKLALNDRISEDWATSSTVDIAPEVRRVQSSGADCVVPWLNPENAARFVQTMKSLGAKMTVLANDAAYGDVTFPKLAGAAADGTISAELKALLAPNSALQKYQSDYKARFGATADIYGAQSYDSILMLAKAIETAGSFDKNKVRDALEKMSSYEGITGTLGFGPDKHESITPESLAMIKYTRATQKWIPLAG